MCPFGSASTREPSEARRVGTITTTCPSRTTTPPAERSRTVALRPRLRGLADIGSVDPLLHLTPLYLRRHTA